MTPAALQHKNQAIKTFPPGSVLFKEGQKGREAFVVLDGQVVLTQRNGATEKELAVLGPGSVLGEMALLDGQSRSATATTKKQTRMIVVDEHSFQSLLNRLPLWLTSILRIVSSRLRDTNKALHSSPPCDLSRVLSFAILQELHQPHHPSDPGIDYYRLVEETTLHTEQPREKVAAQLQVLVNTGIIILPMIEGTRWIKVLQPQKLEGYHDNNNTINQNNGSPTKTS